MSKLLTMTLTEYRMDVRTRSFWLTTILLPVLSFLFIWFIAANGDNDAMKSFNSLTSPDIPKESMSGMQLVGMLTGVFLFMFVMMYGAQIFNKVKTEKCNRIVEVLISCVPGRTVMLSKVICVAMLGITQMCLWGVLVLILLIGAGVSFPTQLVGIMLMALCIAGAYFVGGFVFYGALFAAAGALTDRNNENQGYLSVIMVLLMASFYIGIVSAGEPGSALSSVCFYLPFTSPVVGAMQSVGSNVSWWQTLLTLAVLYASAYVSLVFAGKIYTASVLLKGKKFTPRDLVVFLRAK